MASKSSTAAEYIQDLGRENKYFHQMLNMADDDLNPYQYRLLGHYKRVCGENGVCWESVRTTADKCQMSIGKVSQTRRELENMGYIKTSTNDTGTITVTLVDRWAENIQRYSQCSSGEQGVHVVNASVHVVKQRITIEEEPLFTADEPAVNLDSPEPALPIEKTEAIDLAEQHIEKTKRRANPNEPMRNALLDCFGLTPEGVTKTADSAYWKVAAELNKIKFPIELIPTYHRSLTKKAEREKWNGFTVIVLSKYAGDFLKAYRDQLAGKPAAHKEPSALDGVVLVTGGES